MTEIKAIIRVMINLDIESGLFLVLYFIILGLCHDAMTIGRITNFYKNGSTKR